MVNELAHVVSEVRAVEALVRHFPVSAVREFGEAGVHDGRMYRQIKVPIGGVPGAAHVVLGFKSADGANAQIGQSTNDLAVLRVG